MNNYGLVESLAFNLKSGTCVRVWFNTMHGLSSDVGAIRNLIKAKVNKYVDGVVSHYNHDGNPISVKGSQTVIIKTGYGNITLNIQDFIDEKIKFIELIPDSQTDISEEPNKNFTFTRKELRDIILKWIDYVREIHEDANDYHINETGLHVYVHVYEGSRLIAYLYIEMIYDKNNNLVGYRIYNNDSKPNAPFIVIDGFTATAELRNLKRLGSSNTEKLLSDAKQLFNYITAGFKFTKQW